MKIVYILAAVFAADLTVTRHDTEAACLAAMAVLPAGITSGGECVEIEVLVESSPYAPILSPLPPRKP